MASNANLGQHLEDYVTELVKTGRYRSRSDVLREGVRLIEEREKRLAALDRALRQGMADAENGYVTPLDAAFDRIRASVEADDGESTPA
ncbi:type II toxin-antitoxin system ParD family antitoxin [Jiella sonneratiae]|uniref:Type II toxin-antitoxin system ParD family antitoxin n=1 Tax=Jiella sonneratiae TaxID=2816856 RepID=A0ABS3J4J1_9HYPH|nr:type II toxin-antitoxin system ParD family antitoxin [Jiella sonneratiae]MBO0903863.1 type II toxin-antitoxin system ParD family antitoxin [Jiella sonneratiae]